MIKNYRKRVIDKKIEKYLTLFGAICIEGPKYCGKTWTASEHAKSSIHLGDPNNNFSNRNIALMSPNLVFNGEKPRLVDEWQEVPELWDATRHFVDQTTEKGIIILTGSSTPNRKGILHSGAGRIATIKMSTMSLYESGNSTGDVSLSDILNNNFQDKITGEVDLKDLIHYIVRGGWPGNINSSLENAGILPSEYINTLLTNDVFKLDEIRRDSIKMEKLLRSLARNVGTTASINTIKKDIVEFENSSLEENTINTYIDTLERLYIVNNLKPFSEKVRSSVRVKQQSKRYFVDPSLAVALLKLNPTSLLNDTETLGFLFESLVVRDIQVYAESMNASVYHYQNYKNEEIDLVIELDNGDFVAIEIKLGENQIDKAAENLLKVNNNFEKKPIALIVICGLTNVAYKRKDGVYVIPITALKN